MEQEHETTVGPTAPLLIGISSYLEPSTTGGWDRPSAVLPEVYLAAVIAAGCTPVVLPPQPVTADVVARVLDALDGLVLAGGADVDPARYGQVPAAGTEPPRADRDAWEIALLEGAIARDLPFLAICRGIQLLNVVRGGTLHQHLPEVIGHDAHHPAGFTFGQVEVSLDPGTRLAAIYALPDGGTITVPCLHHQALADLGSGLVPVAWTADGVVEAVETEHVTFGLAVQWHPEESPTSGPLFDALAEAARRYRSAPDRATHPMSELLAGTATVLTGHLASPLRPQVG